MPLKPLLRNTLAADSRIACRDFALCFDRLRIHDLFCFLTTLDTTVE